MLYKLGQTNGIFDSLEAVPFQSVPLEKHLEDLLAKSLLDVLFEGNELMPIFQERSQQEEADIYALNKQGGLVIFELKRDGAGSDAVHQALRYCEKAAHWKYVRLQEMLATYTKVKPTDLQKEHQKNFNLEHPLEKSAFNTRQRLIVVGNAASENLIRNVDYWKSKGLLIDFIPYRIYALKNGDQKEHYFEFFSIPYDKHSNPAHIKGVLFDTCRSYNKDSIWYMCEKDRVAAFDQAHVVSYLGKNDIVFLYHKGVGIIAAGKVISGVKEDADMKGKYRDLEWLTAKPVNGGGKLKAMPPKMIKKVLGHNFFWARTIKTPYLSKLESEKLLEALIRHIGPKA
jgi:hypothetical protein